MSYEQLNVVVSTIATLKGYQCGACRPRLSRAQTATKSAARHAACQSRFQGTCAGIDPDGARNTKMTGPITPPSSLKSDILSHRHVDRVLVLRDCRWTGLGTGSITRISPIL